MPLPLLGQAPAKVPPDLQFEVAPFKPSRVQGGLPKPLFAVIGRGWHGATGQCYGFMDNHQTGASYMKSMWRTGLLAMCFAAAWSQSQDAIERYLAMLERPEREEFQKPKQVIAELALRPGERVADIGAGSGYFTIPAAKAVGPRGVVWAIDIRQPMLDYIAARLRDEKLSNVRLKLVAADDPQLPPGGVDTILMVDVYHYIHFEKRGAEYATKLLLGLAPGGRVAVIDYIPRTWEQRPWGPPPEQQMSREKLDEYMAAGGLRPARVHRFLPEQYFVEYTTR